MDRLARGLRNDAIAARMGISMKTVQNNISSILLKLGAVDRTQVVAIARDAGLGLRTHSPWLDRPSRRTTLCSVGGLAVWPGSGTPAPDWQACASMNDEPVQPPDVAHLPAGVRRMLTAAASRGLAVEVRPRPPARSLEEAAALLGIRPADIAKTLVLRRSGDLYLYAVIPGDTQIAWPRLRTVAGVNKMTLPDAAAALTATGYERGTISPVGAHGDWPIYVDQRLVGRRVAMGSGSHGFSAFLDVDDLVASYHATVADIAE